MPVASALLILINFVLLVPVLTFAVEIVAGLLPPRRSVQTASRPDLAILVPAHQEEAGIAATLDNLRAQLTPKDRLIVIADNCTDATADLARRAGAEVIERHDSARRGKGYALDYGIRYLEAAPPQIVIIVDADCTLKPGCIDVLARQAMDHGRPTQGLYLMHAPHNDDLKLAVAAFAFRVKNHLRPRGLARLNLPCQLTGTGMAFPWAIIRDADLAHASLVEDMKLGVELALAGTPPLFVAEARIDSIFPLSSTGAATQRQRWEQGHLGMIGQALRLVPAAIKTRRLDALTLILDLLVPPLTMLLVLVGAALVSTLSLTMLLGLPPLAIGLALANAALLGGGVALAWLTHGRRVLPARALLGIIPYIGGKLGLYAALARGKGSKGWIRTDRHGPRP
ncbi:glycosyltransferase family 2 protein [Devosia faecipullorum]|uniref:glycosyltransferase family 2 protein n=1 Tax=Devosia faecipullorum TaxID=2755039 RepID=UPI00187B323F|nr:glycosyltransferase family 2 protein [Devosia faecipullorum]MBE7732888.1 glycosyltransferase family 2 protein [Devosia faecipullorum]